MQRMAMHMSPRCSATTRRGKSCRSPAVKGKRVCRMHGGGKGSGAPHGAANGAWKHGGWTNEAEPPQGRGEASGGREAGLG